MGIESILTIELDASFLYVYIRLWSSSFIMNFGYFGSYKSSSDQNKYVKVVFGSGSYHFFCERWAQRFELLNGLINDYAYLSIWNLVSVTFIW